MTSAQRAAGPETAVAAPPTGLDPSADHETAEQISAEQVIAEHIAAEHIAAGQVPVPQDQAGIDALRLEIDAVDADIVRLIKRRTAISNAIGTARKSLGGPRIVYSREMAILERFRELGPAGTDLGMMLLAMGRGRLGRK